MGRSVVIVESPAKARTIEKFLGKGFKVAASMGHVRDLPQKVKGEDIGVDVEKNFRPTYQILPDKKKVIEGLKKDAKGAVVTCSVTIGPRDAGGFGLMVKLHVKDDSLPKDELLALANEAHEKICPYSHATRGNVPVEIEVDGA